MHRISEVFATFVALTIVAAGSAFAQTDANQQSAQDQKQESATRLADQTIPKLAAWQTDQAKAELESKPGELGDTASFKTAWGFLRAVEGKPDEGLGILSDASKADAKNPAPEFLRGEVLSWQKKSGEATAAYQRAADRATSCLAAQPNDARALYYLGAANVRLKKFDAARSKLEAALKAGYDRALVKYQIGLSYAFEKKWEAAKAAFDESIQANSGFAHAYFYRGRVWKELKRTDEMLRDMDRFVKLAPNAPEAPIARSILGG